MYHLMFIQYWSAVAAVASIAYYMLLVARDRAGVFL